MEKSIFLIEDDSAILDIYQTVLTGAGFAVQVFSLGQDVVKKVEAIAANQEQKPDLVLLDLVLPDMHGTEILKKIRATQATQSVKVFILSNQQPTEIGQLEAQPDKFIIKANITPTQLVETINKELS